MFHQSIIGGEVVEEGGVIAVIKTFIGDAGAMQADDPARMVALRITRAILHAQQQGSE